jgi:hypothetical protein
VWPLIALFSAQSGRMIRLRHAGRMALRCQRGAVFFSSSDCKCLRKRFGVIFDDAVKFYPLRRRVPDSGRSYTISHFFMPPRNVRPAEHGNSGVE